MADATAVADFGCAGLTAFCRLDELGLVVTGQRLDPDRAVLACPVVEADQYCRRCGGEGVVGDTVIRRLAHEPPGLASDNVGSDDPSLPVRPLQPEALVGRSRSRWPQVGASETLRL